MPATAGRGRFGTQQVAVDQLDQPRFMLRPGLRHDDVALHGRDPQRLDAPCKTLDQVDAQDVRAASAGGLDLDADVRGVSGADVAVEDVLRTAKDLQTVSLDLLSAIQTGAGTKAEGSAAGSGCKSRY